MKQELPFAIALLAAGCLLWLSHSTEPANSNAVSDTDSSTELIAKERSPETQHELGPNGAFEHSHVVQASFLAAGNELPSESDAKTTTPNSPTQLPLNAASKFIHADSNQVAVEFLAEVSKRVAASQPLSCSVQMTGNVFGEVVSATGSYYQMGQGTSKSRIELNFGMLPNSPRVFQLCDGRFVYKLQTEGDQRSFEFVDLLRVRESAGEQGTGITPTGWVATGGVASLYQHLASAFNFGEPETIDGEVVLQGSWDEDALRQILKSSRTKFQPTHSPMSAQDWESVPGQLPHAVELVFQEVESIGYFPKRVSFLKFATGKKNHDVLPKRSVSLEFSHPQPLQDITERFFVIDSSNLESVDLTGQYIARIESLNETKQAANESATIER